MSVPAGQGTYRCMLFQVPVGSLLSRSGSVNPSVLKRTSGLATILKAKARNTGSHRAVCGQRRTPPITMPVRLASAISVPGVPQLRAVRAFSCVGTFCASFSGRKSLFLIVSRGFRCKTIQPTTRVSPPPRGGLPRQICLTVEANCRGGPPSVRAASGLSAPNRASVC